jgi:hypothetical protein
VFCWQDHSKKREVVSSKPITPTMVSRWLNGKEGRHLMNRDYHVHKVDGRLTVMKEVRRIDDNTLEMRSDDGHPEQYRYRYVRDVEAGRDVWSTDVRFEAHRPDLKFSENGWIQIRNWSTQNCLTFFLRYEKIWESSKWTPGKKLPEKESWAVHESHEETTFPDGDGYTWKE